MMKELSVPVLLVVTIVSAVAGYSWGVYTNTNPDYDFMVRKHFQEGIEEGGSGMIVRKPAAERILVAGSVNTEHGVALDSDMMDTFVDTTAYTKHPLLLMKATRTDGGVLLSLQNTHDLPADVRYSLAVNDAQVGMYDTSEIVLDDLLPDTTYSFVVTVLDNDEKPLLDAMKTPLHARADLVQ